MVTWRGGDQDGSGYGVFGQRYAADGTATGTEFQVNTYTSDNQQEPSVTGLADGGFVVTWMSITKTARAGVYTASVMRLMARPRAMSS